MPDQNNTNADAIPPINDGFTQGGDLTLRSTDGVEFSVHSILLSLASPVFSQLIRAWDKQEVIQSPERSEILALILKSIYPTPTPIISSVGLLSDVLWVANKYQLEGAKERLRDLLTRADSPVSIFNNPMGMLYVASLHGFTTEANLASKQCKFREGADLKKLLGATSTPATTALVKFTGIPLVKTRVLIEVLFHFEHSPMTIYNDGAPFVEALTCGYCRETFRNIRRQSPPEWQFRWAHWIYDEIKDRPIAEWEGYFSHSNVHRSFYQPHLQPTYCAYRHGDLAQQCLCIYVVANAATQFQQWADGVFEHLKSRLSVIAELEAQSTNLS
ncbi:hypothetical protein RSAG8_08191, partial [Rhizoctonia solani AG-8 WAC10335]